MVTLPLSVEMSEISRRVIWFEEPEQAIVDPIRFLTYAMNFAYPEDWIVLQRFASDDDLCEVLANAPPGIFSDDAWIHWHNKLGVSPVPPLPERILPDDC